MRTTGRKAHGPSARRTAREQRNEDPSDFAPFLPIGEAIALLLHPFGEVVLHDRRSGNIVHIWNAFGNRKAGDPSHLEGAPDLFTDDQVLGPYEKALAARGRTKSITAAIRDRSSTIIGFFCVNLNISVLDDVAGSIKNFVMTAAARPESIYRNDLQEHVNYVVRDYTIAAKKAVANMTRSERRELISELDDSGVFNARNAVNVVAKALEISRASVYNLLAENRAGRDDASHAVMAASRLPHSQS